MVGGTGHSGDRLELLAGEAAGDLSEEESGELCLPDSGRDPGLRSDFIAAAALVQLAFLKADPAQHDSALADAAIERGRAYAEAGANGFFIPGLGDLQLVERICREVALPVNAMHFPDAPTRRQWADAGIARISHGPFPHMDLMKRLTEMASAAIN